MYGGIRNDFYFHLFLWSACIPLKSEKIFFSKQNKRSHNNDHVPSFAEVINGFLVTKFNECTKVLKPLSLSIDLSEEFNTVAQSFSPSFLLIAVRAMICVYMSYASYMELFYHSFRNKLL